VSKINKLKHIR